METLKIFGKKVLCPFLVVRNEPIFLFWLVATLIIAPLGSWIIFVNNPWEKVLESFSNTLSLTLSLSLITPIILDFIFDSNVIPRLNKKVKFATHKSYLTTISVLLIIVLFCVLGIRQRENFVMNFVLAIVSIFISFYLYCVSKMALFRNLDEFDSKPYNYEEQQRRKKLKEDAAKINVIDGDVKV